MLSLDPDYQIYGLFLLLRWFLGLQRWMPRGLPMDWPNSLKMAWFAGNLAIICSYLAISIFLRRSWRESSRQRVNRRDVHDERNRANEALLREQLLRTEVEMKNHELKARVEKLEHVLRDRLWNVTARTTIAEMKEILDRPTSKDSQEP